ncbi:MAG: heparinase II/III family protein [Treponema sp.]|jgi:hypothetical protein|nr:heparinase II/III family protein [Treponema sp.]
MAWTAVRGTDELKADIAGRGYAGAWSAVRENAEWWMANFNDSAETPSGWWHNYYCPSCAAPLEFDRARPGSYKCSACGAVAERTKLLDEAWVYYYRYDLSEALIDAAVAHRVTGEAGFADFVKNTILWYAERYSRFEEHGAWAGRGKVQGQSLDEAVWGVNLLRALKICSLDPFSEEGRRMYRDLFLPMARLVTAQSWGIHNIPLWHASFAAAAALFFDDKKLYQQSMGGDLGARRQVLEGFTADGIWYENSTGYHYYSLEAATYLAAFLKESGLEEEEAEFMNRVRDAYLVFPRLSFRDGSLPSFNDSSKSMKAMAERAAIYVAARLFPESAGELFSVVAGETQNQNSRAKWLYSDPGEPRGAPLKTEHLPANCIAILRTPDIEVFTKYGNLAASHSHPDALEICIPPFAMDPGNTGYGSPICRDWYRSTAAHCTFTVDGKNQNSTANGSAETRAGPDGASSIRMEIGGAFEGVRAIRSLKVAGNILEDELELFSDEEHTYDWFFHGAGVFEAQGELVPASINEKENGYSYLKDCHAWTGRRCSWELRGKRLELDLEEIPQGAAAYVFKTQDNPAIETRRTILLRLRCAASRVFKIRARFTLY